jgi:hypothetical protein
MQCAACFFNLLTVEQFRERGNSYISNFTQQYNEVAEKVRQSSLHALPEEKEGITETKLR